jgi:hypothetical protein
MGCYADNAEPRRLVPVDNYLKALTKTASTLVQQRRERALRHLAGMPLAEEPQSHQV